MDVQESISVQEENDVSRGWHVVAILLAVLGLLVSLYAIYHHRLIVATGKTDAFCNINAVINCDAMELSGYSKFLTLPWGVWGTAYFVAALLLLFFSFRRMGNRQEHLMAYSFWVGAGFLVSMALAFISFKIIGAACLICMSVYGINAAQAVGLWMGFKKKYISFANFKFKSFYSGLVTSTIGFAAVLIVYNIIGEQDLVKPLKPTTGQVDAAAMPKTSPDVHNIPLSLSQYSGMGEDYRKGPEEAKVTIIIFSDFQCPGCKGVSDLLEEVYQSFPGKIRLVYRNFPLDQACNPIMQHKMHEFACSLATMARCAGRYGKFWPYHDLAFAKQSELKDGSPTVWAKEIGLSTDQIKGCWTDKGIADKLKDDMDVAAKLGIDGTPTVYLNGRRFIAPWPEIRDEVKRLTDL